MKTWWNRLKLSKWKQKVPTEKWFLGSLRATRAIKNPHKSSEYYNCLVSSRKETQNLKRFGYPSKNIQENNTIPKPKVCVPNSHISFYCPGMHELFPTFETSFFQRPQHLSSSIKPNYFKEQCSSSSFLLAWNRYTGPKWPLSTE